MLQNQEVVDLTGASSDDDSDDDSGTVANGPVRCKRVSKLKDKNKQCDTSTNRSNGSTKGKKSKCNSGSNNVSKTHKNK